MKNLLIFALFLGQIAASLWLAFTESWLSGLLFFLISLVFIGLMLNAAEKTNQIWDAVFGKNNRDNTER